MTMAISEFEIKRIAKLVGNFIEQRRPSPEIRQQLDLGFRISNQSFEIFEIRPRFDNPKEKITTPVAKATYVKSKKLWKLYWMRADLKWHSYQPFPTSTSLERIIKAINEDEYCCFWG